jgi:transcriptional regulator with XRE-family HTH domain
MGLVVSQTLVARVERGLVQDPRPELLQAIARVLNLPMRQEGLLAELVSEKYDIQREKLSPLRRRPLTAQELAEWESQQAEIWIVASNIRDTEDSRFLSAVRDVIERNNGEVIFFIPETLIPRFETVKLLAHQNLTRPEAENKIQERLLSIPFGLNEEAVLGVNFVIANASNKIASNRAGYFILNNEHGVPSVALEMFSVEIDAKVGLLNTVKHEYLAKRSQLTRSIDQDDKRKNRN